MPARSRRTSASPRISSATTAACPAPTSSASSGASHSAARRRMTSSPSAPANSAPGGSWRELGRQLRARLDVRRVGEHGVRPARGVEQVGRERTRRRAPAARALARATATRLGTDVAAADAQVRPLVLERQRHRAAARAGVVHARALGQREPDLDEQLGLRARDEHARVDHQVDVAKALGAEQVGDRLAPHAAAPDEVLEGAHRGPSTGRSGSMNSAARSTPSAWASSSCASRSGRVGPRCGDRDARRIERVADRRAGRGAHAAACASRRRRFSSASSAAVNSSRSPSSTWSRLCAVSLMRWSVTRRSP